MSVPKTRIHFVSFGDVSSSPMGSGLKYRSYAIAEAFAKEGFLCSLSCFALDGVKNIPNSSFYYFAQSRHSRTAAAVNFFTRMAFGEERFKNNFERITDEVFFDFFLARNLLTEIKKGDIIIDSKSVSPKFQEMARRKGAKYVYLTPVCHPVVIQERLEQYCALYDCVEQGPYVNRTRTKRYTKFLQSCDALYSLLPSRVAADSYSDRKAPKLICPTVVTRPHSVFFECALKGPSTNIRFLADGGSTHKKGLMLLLDAWRHVSIQGATLSIIGSPPNLVDTDIHNLRWLPRTARMDQYFADCDVFICPSVIDLGPRIAFEALAAATPVIASSTTGVAGIMPESAGIVVPACDAGALVEAIEQCVRNPQMIVDMSIKAREFAETFTTEGFVRELCDFVQALQ